MEKFKAIMIVMVVVFALSAWVASSASAEATLEAKWLTGTGNNIAVGTELASTITGEVTLEDTKAKTAVLCSGRLDGTVSASGAGILLSVLTLSGNELGELKGTGLACTNVTGCSGSMEVWPEGLPWVTTLYLNEAGKIQTRTTGSLTEKDFGYSVLCTILGINVLDTCIAPVQKIETLNDTNGDAEASEGGVAEPLTNCSVGGSGAGKNTTDVLSPVTLTNGELLSVSSE